MTAPVQPIKVLLVDDHPVVRTGLRALLEGFEGVEVVGEAADGTEALTKVHDGIDVVVMDIEMPGLDGITTTERITAQNGPPVLILTTYDTQSDVLAAVDAGAKGYLLKDAAPEKLRRAILDTAAGKPTLSSEVAALLMNRMQQPRLSLSTREVELLAQLATGATNKQLAKSLFISEATVKTHLVHIYQKLGVTNRTAAINMAREQRLI
ncbi:MAG: response regulator transcription factor [Yaniella sp.]|uniref:response regulator transcription factor n=2 Tax=Yaniella sp. TaxID=2773929 RepID=UPI00264818FB|nr:response regulator transcription factor [Yaniella sp.]MDN5703772.1 response regulator transcription factor [Yaniella sp.]MDN5731693.1 response regulator transcription factor [Yaniella sp.]MDN5741977.1 response regulator transcription factor [Yaniella sp.]MDN5818097.1 response regulator transcription factor [Yaniella sp.]MDN5838369.1 response regulator transcription factor [Yaniella sp.]